MASETIQWRWKPICRGEPLPLGCVCAGNTSKDGDVFVGRDVDHQESGKINLDNELMYNLWTHMHGQFDKAEILVIPSTATAEWVPISKGDPLPVGVVLAGKNKTDGDVYVARKITGQCGKLNVDKDGRARNIWCHGGNTLFASKEGDVLVVRDGVNARLDETSERCTSLEQLSYIGESVACTLQAKHEIHRRSSWNVTSGRIVNDILQTPPRSHWGKPEVQPLQEHSDELPQRMHDVIVKAERWVDFASLAPPDGKFHKQIHDAICELGEKAARLQSPITIRLLFGNIIGMPVDCRAVLKSLKPKEDKFIELWVGSYRKGLSWNHSKIIAVDGTYLLQGGHNCWDDHYLKWNPVHDISIEAEGDVTQDAHIFCNKMWQFLIGTDRKHFVSKMVWDVVPVSERTSLSRWPQHICKYPPMYVDSRVERPTSGMVPMISCGRHGEIDIVDGSENPSDSAITAMIASAKKIIRLSLQDLGCLMLPLPGDAKVPIPGGSWPHNYLKAMASALVRGVKVQIVLSNPGSTPGRSSPLTSVYGNGWTCADSAGEIPRQLQNHLQISITRCCGGYYKIISLSAT
jgi:hypothetical protein